MTRNAKPSRAGRIARRTFLVGAGVVGGSLVIGIGAMFARLHGIDGYKLPAGEGEASLGAWLKFARDGKVEVAVPHQEMGQGIYALAVLLAAGLAGALSLLAGYRVRRAPTWGCGGELTARTEYTATAFSKPLMMIFRAVYRPTRHVETVGGAHFPREVRYRAEIEPTFERFLYQPLTRGVLGVAERMKVIQAGSLHAYLAYVIVLVLSLVLLLWWSG